MFRSFFLQRRWWLWSIVGSLMILVATWYRVELDVEINHWFRDFYDMVQQVLAQPNSIFFEEFLLKMFTFGKIAGVYIVIAVLLDFFVRHYVFRWRTAMTEYYTAHWEKLRHIEGASQRVQEDTMRFARIVEGLAVTLLHSVLILIAFLPELNKLSQHVTELPWIGAVPHSMVLVALISAIVGTTLLACAAIRLPGLEFNNQKVEAAYRKELVFGEEYAERAQPETLGFLYENIRKNYFVLYLNYLYFDLVKWTYLQASVLFPYIALGPSLISGALTLGILQQIVRAFGKVEGAFQFLVTSWGSIVELMSIYKRLNAFEKILKTQ